MYTVGFVLLVRLLWSENLLKKFQKLSLINFTFTCLQLLQITKFSFWFLFLPNFELYFALQACVTFDICHILLQNEFRRDYKVEQFDHLGFLSGVYFISEKRCYRNTKRMIDYFAATMCFIILNKLKQFGFYSTCYLIMFHNEGTLRKIFFTVLKFEKNNIYYDLERSGCF